MKFSIIITLHTKFEFDFDVSTANYYQGWVVDITIPFLDIGFGTGIKRET